MTSRFRLAVATVTAVLASALVGVAPPAGPVAAANDPVVVVGGTISPELALAPLRKRLSGDGYDTFTFALPGGGIQDIARSSQALADFVATVRRTTGSSKVDLVAHSQGGLVSRYYVKYLGGSATVDSLVTLGSPNYGTTLAELGPALGVTRFCEACEQMRRGSAFLNDLNAGDDTIGSVKYTNIYSDFDEIVFPANTAAMRDGATNVRLQRFCWRVVGHLGLLLDGPVYDGVRDALRNRSVRPNCWKL